MGEAVVMAEEAMVAVDLAEEVMVDLGEVDLDMEAMPWATDLVMDMVDTATEGTEMEVEAVVGVVGDGLVPGGDGLTMRPKLRM